VTLWRRLIVLSRDWSGDATVTPTACPHCGGGSIFLDSSERKAPALACYICGERVEVDASTGAPLIIDQPLYHGGPLEERIIVMLAQGLNSREIARRLRCGVTLVKEIQLEAVAGRGRLV